MAKRYVGDAVIDIRYRGYNGNGDEYVGRVTAYKNVWKFKELYAPKCGFEFAYDSPKAYDKMAGSAVCFGSYYTTLNRGDDYADVSDWAPSPEVADAIDEAVGGAQDDQGTYEVRRKK